MGILTSNLKSSTFDNGQNLKIQSRLINPSEQSYQSKAIQNISLQIKPFRYLQDWQLSIQNEIQYKFELNSNTITREIFFNDSKQLDIYLSQILKLKEIIKIQMYDSLDIKFQKIWSLVIKKTLKDVPKWLNKIQLASNIPYFVSLLIYLANMIKNVENLYITPNDIVTLNGQFYLTAFRYKKYEKSKLILAFIKWVYINQWQQFDDCFRQQLDPQKFIEIDIYLKEVILSIQNEKISQKQLPSYLISINKKIRYLGKNLESLHACFKAKKMKFNLAQKNDWLLAKKGNQVYFFNIEDKHVCQGRIIRKKRKVNIDNCMICFNPQEFQIFFFLQGTKNIVKTSQFELSDCFTISDITIKSKFPFKIRNPLIFHKQDEIYIFDQMLYIYHTKSNKLVQQSKKINDCLALVPSLQFKYLIIRISIDIFKHGIRVYMQNKLHSILLPSGDPAISQDIENIRVDIKHVQFCIELYKGIYLMLANKNLWILDINFMCFFSFTPFQRLKQYIKSKQNSDQHEYIFEILNQNFNFTWLPHQNGINVLIKKDQMHIIGSLMGKLYYLKYLILFQSGQLQLLSYRPLYSQIKDQIKEQPSSQHPHKQHSFNVYNQNYQLYKYNPWTYQGPIFLEVKDIKLTTFKNYTQFNIYTEDTLYNLKQMIEKYKNIKWTKFQTTLILYQIYNLFQYINNKQIAHKNFNINNIWITHNKMIKLIGWSQSQKNWYISDYRDFLLVCFNVITRSTYQKFTDKNYIKHASQLSQHLVIKDKIDLIIRNKKSQKKGQFQKQILQIKTNLLNQIYSQVSKYKGLSFIFNFQHNTPRFSILNIIENKIKKLIAIYEGSNVNQEFTFKVTDNYAWNQEESILYIMTAAYQMYELKINCSDYKEQTLVLEEYEYLPNNINQFNVIYTKKGLYAFGGIARNSKKKIQYNKHIYHFNKQKLTWQSVGEMPQPKINPQLTLSQTGNYIYIIGGDLDQGGDYFSYYKFDLQSKALTKQIDIGLLNPIRSIDEKNVYYIVNISQKYNIFLIWSISSTSYKCLLFSNMINGFQITFDGKIYIEDNIDFNSISMSFYQGNIHFLRSYGKYSKIITQGLINPKLINKTLYAIQK